MGEAVRREGVEEDAAVALALDAGVEQHEDAAVVKRADEAAEALLQGDDSAGHLVVEEGACRRLLRSRPMRALTTGSDGTAKGRRSMMTQESCSPCTSTPCQKLEVPKSTALGVSRNCCEQDVARSSALHEEREGQLGQHALVHDAHLRVAGEQAEGAASGDLEHAAGALGGLREEVGVARVGHAGGQIQQRLLLVVEVGWDDELAGVGQAEALARCVRSPTRRSRRRR